MHCPHMCFHSKNENFDVKTLIPYIKKFDLYSWGRQFENMNIIESSVTWKLAHEKSVRDLSVCWTTSLWKVFYFKRSVKTADYLILVINMNGFVRLSLTKTSM